MSGKFRKWWFSNIQANALDCEDLKVILATRNRKKVEEFQRVLEGTSLRLLDLREYPQAPEVVEDGATFTENAVKKALQIARFTGLPALADDSGLEVDALGKRPGVHSARYAGPDATDRQNLEKMLLELGDCPASARTARFVCVLAMADASGRTRIFAGVVEGRISSIPQGENGFGYDPVFVPEGESRTFAQMSSVEKDAMSHRGRAIASLVAALNDHGESFLT
ncbi:MAG: XTP/dITP diphosphatase [Magnetococcales bacterium]|nr:XTP/dITP diphosphatase [Magnetococcales bacterium]